MMAMSDGEGPAGVLGLGFGQAHEARVVAAVIPVADLALAVVETVAESMGDLAELLAGFRLAAEGADLDDIVAAGGLPGDVAVIGLGQDETGRARRVDRHHRPGDRFLGCGGDLGA